MDRIILHSDIDNFFASVEIQLDRSLVGKCVAVAGDPKKRHGIVLAKSTQAKAYGVKTGEPLWQAKQKCPEIVFVPPNFKKYTEYSNAVYEIYTRYTDLVESFGLDECWLDTTGSVKLYGDGLKIAQAIRKDVKKETGLTVSIGVSFNKIFAKIGSDIDKPDAVTVIDRDNFKRVVWHLPAHSMIFVGKQTATALSKIGIHTIGDIAACDKQNLLRLFGKMGIKFYEYAWGKDNDAVKRYDDVHIPDSVSNGTTTASDIGCVKDAERVIFALCEVIGYRLRRLKMVARGVSISLRDIKLKTITRQETQHTPISTAYHLAERAINMLKEHYNFSLLPALRTITISAYALSEEGDACQMSLFSCGSTKDYDLESNIDKIRDKYGYAVIQRALNLEPPFSCDVREIDDNFIPFDKRNAKKRDN